MAGARVQLPPRLLTSGSTYKLWPACKQLLLGWRGADAILWVGGGRASPESQEDGLGTLALRRRSSSSTMEGCRARRSPHPAAALGP